MAGYKINASKSVAFIYSKDKQTEKEIREMTPFTIATNRASIESVDCLWQDGHFKYINLANPRAWKIFPFSEIFFDFLLQRSEVLVISLVWLGSPQDTLCCL